MQLDTVRHKADALTRRDLVTIIAIIAVLVCVGLIEFAKARYKSQAICCNCNLKQVGLSFKTWAFDQTNNFPMSLSTNLGGTREYITTGETFRHFAAISNELSTPRVLVCPRD